MSPIELVQAIRAGDVATVDRLLGADPTLATTRVDGRSMLHHATDWPGHWPEVARTIERLVAAGADPNTRVPHPDNPNVAETPLHWAASSNDVAAVNALLDAGASVDSVGGIFDGCTPFAEAVIFGNHEAAVALMDRGATVHLPGAAALGRADLVDAFFDESGQLRSGVGQMPNWSEPPPAQALLDRALWFACQRGHLEIARALRDRGADPSVVLDPPGTTALEEAEANDHATVASWLRSLN